MTVKIATLIASRNRPDLVTQQVAHLREKVKLDNTIIVVECGTDIDKLTEHTTICYTDDPFRGKCFGHTVAMDYARRLGHFDYYWILHNDLLFDQDVDPAAALIDAMRDEPRMAICSPMNQEGHFPQGYVQTDRDWHPTCVCDYLGFMMRGDAVAEVGFLNSDFKYCWGAIHELAFKLYNANWFIAYSDKLQMNHLGGSTYGQKGTGTISRDEYQKEAKRFAYDYFLEHFGQNWDELFWNATEKHNIEFNAFEYHKNFWAKGFDATELDQRQSDLTAAAKRCHVQLTPPSDKAVKAPYAQPDATIPDPLSVATQAAKLHPWFYPVQLANIEIPAGVGTQWTPVQLANRIACRQTLIVDEVTKRIDLHGKRVLELACNCGYWSARYAEHGAAWVLGVEGRADYVQQANLYWQTNRFLSPNRYQFMQGDVASQETWHKIKQLGPFDVAICAGILYHLPNYQQIINWLTEVTTQAIIIDTRVGDADETLTREPGDLKFNAIESTLDKVVPNLPKLLACLKNADFDTEIFTPTFGSPPGLQNVDDYATGKRVTLFAQRQKQTENTHNATDQTNPIRLHLGCGPELRQGWINIDANPQVHPDVVAKAELLNMFDDNTADEIEACHLFEHFTFDQAIDALREWHRVLKPGGQLLLELPNLNACTNMIGQHLDPQNYDLGMIGLFGYPPAIKAEGAFQIHKWGWSPDSLSHQLKQIGFETIEQIPVTQTWRHAFKVGRDMRLCAIKSLAIT